ncbi:MAG TPA: GDP-mannose 4,6-dehydratase [Acidobacteriota bacterium]|nr:GDP-mannose 4,6-dehydratase [Acidobacteriota bacterium]
MVITSGKILVTGAGGFIGSHLVEELLLKGCDVRAFIHYNSRNDYGCLEYLGERLGEMEIVSGDLRDSGTVRRAVEGCRLVLHLGALVGIPYSYLSPRDVYDTNVGGTLNVLEAARHCGVEWIVITSTSEVYGTPLYLPIDEKHPLQGQSPYAASKIAADKLAESYHLSFDLPVSLIRPFNTFGSRQSARAIVPTIMIQALKGEKVKLGSLEPSRDLLYVKDTAAGFIAVASHESSIGKVINVGTGGDISVGDLVGLVANLLGKPLEVVEDPLRLRPVRSEIPRLVCNYALAEELLGWEPKHALEEGLGETLDWIRDHLDSYKAGLYNV